MSPIPLGDGLVLHVRHEPDGANTWAVVADGVCVLVDCATPDPALWCAEAGLPPPQAVLHTHVQPGHVREGAGLPGARILVPAGTEDLAGDPAAYARAIATTWERPEEWMTTRGRERYGVAGAVTHLPPAVPVAVAGGLRPGEVVAFGRLRFHVSALPAHSPYAIGLLLVADGRPRAVFCGDLYRDPGVLVNLHDLERGYGIDALPEVPGLLRGLAALGCPLVCPATGPAMPGGDRLALALATRIDAWLAALAWESGRFHGFDNPVPGDPVRHPRLGRWCRRAMGVYQMDQYGNAILLIDGQGRGLMVDPGPCGYGEPDRAGAFRDDLARFERDCGLRTVDLALVTHPHGDHYDMVPELRRRYPTCRVGAWGSVAQVMEDPRAWPYAALLPWYGLGLDRVPVDLVLRRDTPFAWHGMAITTAWLPGHCRMHAGYFCRFNGLDLAFTGDAIQERGRAATWSFIWSNDTRPTGKLGLLGAYRTAARFPTDLNLGGHSSWFTGCAALYAESVARMEHALPFLAALVPDGDLDRAGRRPWHPEPPPAP